MPGGDRTGPMGAGPMTGRGAGYCAGYPTPGYADPVPGRGYRGAGRGAFGYYGRGGGRGWRNRYYATGMTGWQRAACGAPTYGETSYPYSRPTADEEKEMLKREAEALRQDLEGVQNRIEALEQKGERQEK